MAKKCINLTKYEVVFVCFRYTSYKCPGKIGIDMSKVAGLRPMFMSSFS